MSQFRDAYDEFRRNDIEVAAASVDSPYSHQAWAAELDVPFPLLSDFARTLLLDYGIPSRDLHLLPAVGSRSSFIVDADGVIRYAWYATQSGLPPVDEILEAVKRLSETP